MYDFMFVVWIIIGSVFGAIGHRMAVTESVDLPYKIEEQDSKEVVALKKILGETKAEIIITQKNCEQQLNKISESMLRCISFNMKCPVSLQEELSTKYTQEYAHWCEINKKKRDKYGRDEALLKKLMLRQIEDEHLEDQPEQEKTSVEKSEENGRKSQD